MGRQTEILGADTTASREGGPPRAGPSRDRTGGRDRTRMLDIVINAAPGLMAYWDRDLRCRFASRAYAEWFGRDSAEELIGLTQEELLPEVTYRLNRPLIARVLSGAPQQFEREFVKPDGTVVYTLTHYVPDIVRGRVVGFTTHVTDVSRLKESEATLRAEVEERHRANRIIRNAVASLEEAQRLGQIGSWSWTVDPDGTTWSKELYRIMGRDPGEPSPTFAEHGELYSPESWSRLQTAVATALSDGEPYRLNLEYRRLDGGAGWLESRGEAVRDEDGRITGLRGTVQVVATPEQPAT